MQLLYTLLTLAKVNYDRQLSVHILYPYAYKALHWRFLTVSSCSFFLFVCFNLLAAPHGLWNLISLTRDRIHASRIDSTSLNHGTARGVLLFCFARQVISSFLRLILRFTEIGLSPYKVFPVFFPVRFLSLNNPLHCTVFFPWGICWLIV